MANTLPARTTLRAAWLLFSLAGTASGQFWHPPVDRTPERTGIPYAQIERSLDNFADLAGPRFGMTLLGGSIPATLKRDHQIDVNRFITQFGWQLETRFGGNASVTGVTELVGLIGGADQNQFLPSLTWLVGMRTASGYEFGVGPNMSAMGSAVALVGGITHKVGNLNVPVNIAVVPSAPGTRISLLSGFNLGR